MNNDTDLKSRILAEALAVAARVGIAATTRNGVAARVGCSQGSVSYHFGDERKFKRAIVQAANEQENLAVIGWAVAERHPSATTDPALRGRALRKHLNV